MTCRLAGARHVVLAGGRTETRRAAFACGEVASGLINTGWLPLACAGPAACRLRITGRDRIARRGASAGSLTRAGLPVRARRSEATTCRHESGTGRSAVAGRPTSRCRRAAGRAAWTSRVAGAGDEARTRVGVFAGCTAGARVRPAGRSARACLGAMAGSLAGAGRTDSIARDRLAGRSTGARVLPGACRLTPT